MLGNIAYAKPNKINHDISIAVIDIDKVKENSVSAKMIKDRVSDMLSKYQKIIAEIEEKLRQEKEKISEIEDGDEYKKEVTQFEEKYNKFSRFVQKTKYSIDETLKKAEADWFEMVMDVVRDIANHRKCNVVISKNSVLFYNEKLDITQEVSDTINKMRMNIDLTEIDDVGSEIF